ncbi:MAG: RNA polymerase sigma factor [Planctomycetes bacterium]|nr:RNA polymerase sigma factor [Planctomycetota bacterium]
MPSSSILRARRRGPTLLPPPTALPASLAPASWATPVAFVPVSSTDEDRCSTHLMDLFRRTRDREVFDDLVQRNAAMLRRMILGRLRGSCAAIDVNDVLQDTFFNIYRYPSRFRADRPAAFRVWAATIVRNTVHRHLRRAMRRGAYSEASADLLLRSPDPGPGPAEELVSSDEAREAASSFALLLLAWSAAYHELRERDRRVLQLVEVDGLAYREAAAVLGVRPGNLKMLVFRARRRISARIALAFASAPDVAEA